MSDPRTSIIMPVYNTADSVVRAIESVLAQTDPDFELLVIIDGSPDNAAQVINDYLTQHPDQRIRVFDNPNNQGVSAVRNQGIDTAAATGSPSSTQTTSTTPNSSKNFTRRHAPTTPTLPYAGIPSDTATVPKCTGQKSPLECTKAKILLLNFWKTVTPGSCAIKFSVPSYLMGCGSPKTFIAPKTPSLSLPAA